MMTGSSPGLVIVEAPGPALPAEATTVMPSAHNRSTAKSSGSTCALTRELVPQARLTTLMPLAGPNVPIHCRPARTCDTSVTPLAPATLTDQMRAFGATPMYVPPDDVPLPAMMPAMTVPCPYESCRLLPSPDRSTPANRWSRRSGTGVTPVSSTATPTPPPWFHGHRLVARALAG